MKQVLLIHVRPLKISPHPSGCVEIGESVPDARADPVKANF
jgi:hypothetical protein